MPKQRARKRTQSELAAAEVLQAALALSRDSGVDFSLRELAERLETWANTLYSFFPDKRALQAAVIDEVMGEVLRTLAARQPELKALHWDDRLRAVCVELFEALSAHAGAGQLLTFDGLGGSSNGVEVLRSMMVPLVEAGLPAARAAEVTHTLRFFVFEISDLRSAARKGQTNADRVLRKLSEQQDDPLLAAVYAQYSSANITERMLVGINLIISAVQAEVS